MSIVSVARGGGSKSGSRLQPTSAIALQLAAIAKCLIFMLDRPDALLRKSAAWMGYRQAESLSGRSHEEQCQSISEDCRGTVADEREGIVRYKSSDGETGK